MFLCFFNTFVRKFCKNLCKVAHENDKFTIENCYKEKRWGKKWTFKKDAELFIMGQCTFS